MIIKEPSAFDTSYLKHAHPVCDGSTAVFKFRKGLPREQNPRWQILFPPSWQQQWVMTLETDDLELSYIKIPPLAIYREIF